MLPITAPAIRDGAVFILGERIRRVGRRHSIDVPQSTEHRHYEGAVILPGLVNLHTHLEYTHLGPLPGGKPFWQWIPELIRRSQHQSDDYWQTSARAGAKQLIEAGITCVGDIVTHGPGLHAALTHNLAGISFLEVVGIRNSARMSEQLAELSLRLEKSIAFTRGSQRLRIGIGPHSIYTLSTVALKRAAKLADASRLPLTLHLAETAEEVEFSKAGKGQLAEQLVRTGGHDLIEMEGSGLGPASLVDKLGLFASRTEQLREPMVAAHGVHLRDDEITLLANRGVSLALCPRSNAALLCGEPPIHTLVRHGVQLGLGTDSLASNQSLDLFAEAAATYNLWNQQARGAFKPREASRKILRWMTIDGARSLGLAQHLGSITAGKFADLTVVALPNPRDKDLPSQISANIRATDVRCTVVAGTVAYASPRTR